MPLTNLNVVQVYVKENAYAYAWEKMIHKAIESIYAHCVYVCVFGPHGVGMCNLHGWVFGEFRTLKVMFSAWCAASFM